jgi:hypothetical protein
MRIEIHNLDGNGPRPCRVYEMQVVGPHDYWAAVTDVPCPVCDGGIVRWAEAGYVPGYRICDQCQRHFLAKGAAAAPVLIRVHKRKG